MSGDETGRDRRAPDHRTTAEFRRPGAPAEDTIVDGVSAPGPPETLTDAPADVTLTDPPEDTVPPADTIVDGPAEGRWTARHGAEEPGDRPVAPVPPVVMASAAPPRPVEATVPPPPFAVPAPSTVPDEPTAPAGSALPPAGPPAAPPAPSGGPSRRFAVVGGAVVVLALIAAIGVFVWAGGSDGGSPSRPATAAPTGGATPSEQAAGQPTAEPSGQPSGGPGDDEPAATPPAAAPPGEGDGGGGTEPEAPPAGPVVTGDGVTYQLVEQDDGYYEGRVRITNTTGRPLTEWRLTFRVSGGHVRNVWGGRLVHGGPAVEITQERGAAPIPAGAVLDVRFGAEGAPATPADCRVNGRPCGF
ncbi:cellulose binding domain-containing protein [Actinomadura atramentaria]|uniref:cellulose binding domain-containing protein n=1 Tax=Actinomadura atramentaria TaxID=1990 RepID=UPI0003A07C13|nr:cellulose binding domain-containing protein [Actinomadura atramentaria]